MASQIFVNLPVADLERSKNFYTGIGFTINEQFTDQTAACVVLSEHIYVMILTHDKFRQFTTRQIADTTKTCEVLNALSFDSREAVDKIAEAAHTAGGSEASPVSDLGFMYTRTFNDPDGHTWEAFYMDMNALPQG